jgi:hypothetical protein
MTAIQVSATLTDHIFDNIRSILQPSKNAHISSLVLSNDRAAPWSCGAPRRFPSCEDIVDRFRKWVANEGIPNPEDFIVYYHAKLARNASERLRKASGSGVALLSPELWETSMYNFNLDHGTPQQGRHISILYSQNFLPSDQKFRIGIHIDKLLGDVLLKQIYKILLFNGLVYMFSQISTIWLHMAKKMASRDP